MAPARSELTFVTWNIHGCHPGAPFDAAAIADVIARTGAHVVALQEAGALVGGVDQAVAVARLLGMQAIAGPNVTRLGGRWTCGNAILTSLPVIESATNHDLSVEGAERRGCLVARLALPGGGDLLAASAHLGLRHGERTRQARRLAELFGTEDAPLLLGIDGNDWFPGRDTRTLRGSLVDAWSVAGTGAGATYPAALPLLRIDHVYVRGAAVERCESAPSGSASDHRPVVARVSMGGTAMGQAAAQ